MKKSARRVLTTQYQLYFASAVHLSLFFSLPRMKPSGHSLARLLIMPLLYQRLPFMISSNLSLTLTGIFFPFRASLIFLLVSIDGFLLAAPILAFVASDSFRPRFLCRALIEYFFLVSSDIGLEFTYSHPPLPPRFRLYVSERLIQVSSTNTRSM